MKIILPSPCILSKAFDVCYMDVKMVRESLLFPIPRDLSYKRINITFLHIFLAYEMVLNGCMVFSSFYIDLLFVKGKITIIFSVCYRLTPALFCSPFCWYILSRIFSLWKFYCFKFLRTILPMPCIANSPFFKKNNKIR